jgi:hypothetical protein
MVWFHKCKLLLCSALMKKSRRLYNPYHLLSAVFMILALVWLTISAPFVYASLQEHASQDKIENAGSPLSANDEESANPFSNTTEEKAPNSSLSEEYLHDHQSHDCFFSIVLQYHKCENADTYHAFHGELLVPPPNAA